MAHFCVLVITPGPDGVAEALRPFHDDDRDEGPAQPHFVFIEDRHSDINPSTGRRGYWRNPQGKWDGWITGGRFSGLLSRTPDEAEDAPPEAAGNRATVAETLRFLENAPRRARDVFALLLHGQWIEPATDITARLGRLPADWCVTVVDCHS